MNTYEMFTSVRENIGEPVTHSDGHWTDVEILKKIRMAYRKGWNKAAQGDGDFFLTSVDLVPVAGVVTLPEDFGKYVYMENKSTGYPFEFDGQTVRERRVDRAYLGGNFNTGYSAYFVGNTLEINANTYTDTVTLWYEKIFRDPIFGTASAGGATSITLGSSSYPNRTDDYYNNMTIEVFSGTGDGTVATVSDYDGTTKIMTLSAGTYGADTVFGTESVLPEIVDDFVVLDATVSAMTKPSSAVDPKYFQYYTTERRDSLKSLNEYLSSRIKGSQRVRLIGGN